ncbi:MAG: hypothetical protein FJZ79_06835 [Chlorobi bacterium]|nr:hypothetical protein [Chlorobiota bacterium]
MTWVFGEKNRDAVDRPGDVVSYSVNEERTRIETRSEVIGIDYSRLTLCRYRKHDGTTQEFPLHPPASAHEKVRKYPVSESDYRLSVTDRRQTIGNYESRLKQILFGADFAKLQTARAPVIRAFGQDFTESVVQYWVSEDVPGLDRLMRIAEKHEALYRSNPLLRRIDLVGLIGILHGFPVGISQKTRGVEENLILLHAPRTDPESRMPQQCR